MPVPAGRGRSSGVPEMSSKWARDVTMTPPARHNGTVQDGAPQDGATAEEGVGEARAALSDEERGQRLAQLQEIIDLMRPAVQADGGDLVLLSADVDQGIVEVQLQGSCSSCAISSATLQGGVERILKGRLPWLTEVIGGVDELADPFESAAMGRGGYVPRVDY